jgi:lipopolysaccharide biosynthesis protein
LAQLGSRWDDWRSLDLEPMLTAAREEIGRDIARTIGEEFAAAPLFVLKEPRICRFVPFYVKTLKMLDIEPRAILALRNPLAVAASLRARNGIPVGLGSLLWLRHVLDAEHATRNLPRAIVSYEALLADWRNAVSAAGSRMGLRWPRAFEEIEAPVAAFLSRELQHFAPSMRELLEGKAVAHWVRQAYRALVELEGNAHPAGASAMLDRVLGEFNAACPAFAAAMSQQDEARERIAGDMLARQVRIAEDRALQLELRENDVCRLQAELSARDREIGELRSQLALREGELSRSTAELAAQAGEAAKLKHQVEELRTVIVSSQSEVDALNVTLRQERRERAVTARAAQVEQAVLQQSANRLTAEIENLRKRLAKAENEMKHLDADRGRWRTSAEELFRLQEAIYTSTSWRITAPLRGLKRSLTEPGYAGRIGLEAARAAMRRLPASIERKHRLKQWLAGKKLLPPELLPRALRDEPASGVDANRTRARGIDRAKLDTHMRQMFEQAQGKAGLDLEYVHLMEEEIDFSTSPVQLIAFYLPQFHPIQENDAWWGKGFTEWTNVSKAVPQFVGHYQPHLPGELGFYDLRIKEVQQRQIELAKRYGIHGFCFHHYWFGGRKLLERPVAQLLDDPQLEMPFCLCWANENWTRRWDGQEHEVLMAQRHSPEDDIAFIRDIIAFFRDRRYIRIEGRPILIVYRVALLPDARATAARWRKVCREEGVGEPYLIAAQSFGIGDPRPYGFDAAVEFPPHGAVAERLNDQVEIINPAFAGNVYEYNDLAQHFAKEFAAEYPVLKTVAPSWDNEPRRPGRGHAFVGATPAAYAAWLRAACQTAAQLPDGSRRVPFVFINAWNEWAEGAHLEPDRKYGYAYLHATANVLRDFLPIPAELVVAIEETQERFRKTSDTAIVLHLYYEDLLDEIASYLDRARDADLFISVRRDIGKDMLARLRTRFPRALIAAFRNRGRDVHPFLELLPGILNEGYEICCKLHSKKSPSRPDGTRLRETALRSLLGSRDVVQGVRARFRDDSQLGLLASAGSLLALREPDRHALNLKWLDLLLPKLGASGLVGNYECVFPAGSMFWFRPRALSPLLSLGLEAQDFEDELGQLDGTLAHAVERLFAVAAQSRGYSVVEPTQ